MSWNPPKPGVLKRVKLWRLNRKQMTNGFVQHWVALRLKGTAFELNLILNGKISDAVAAVVVERLRISLVEFAGIIFVLVFTQLVDDASNRGVISDASAVALLLGLLLFQVVLLGWFVVSYPVMTLEESFLTLIRGLDSYNRHDQMGGGVPGRRRLIRSIRRVARQMRRYPKRRLNLNDLRSAEIALRRGDSLDALQDWVATPRDEETFWFLAIRVNTELTTVLVNGWHVFVDEGNGNPRRETPLPLRRAVILGWTGGALCSLLVGIAAVVARD